MTALLLKDGLMFVKKCKMYLVFTVFFALTGVVNLDENVFFFFFLSAIYLSMAPLTLLGLEERVKWEIYEATLPISKKKQVLEKYLLAPLGLAAGILINLAVHLAFGNDVRKILDSIPLLLVIVLLFTAFEMPLIYKKGIARARIGYLILVALTIAAVGAAPGMIGEQTEAWAVVVTPGILWGIVAVSAWLFLVSMGISMSIYEKKEL